MVLKVTESLPTGNKTHDLVVPNKFNSIYNINYEELFYDSWFELCEELYRIINMSINLNSYDIYVEQTNANINIHLYIHAFGIIEPKLVF